jgi:hypothetical protein
MTRRPAADHLRLTSSQKRLLAAVRSSGPQGATLRQIQLRVGLLSGRLTPGPRIRRRR